MSKSFDIWNRYFRERKIFASLYRIFYKGKNIVNNIDIIIEQIDKLQYKNICKKDFSEEEIKYKTNDKEIKPLIIEEINDTNFYYIIYIYCALKLNVNLKIRNCPFTIYEIKSILKKINKIFEFMFKKFEVIGGLLISNITFPIDTIDNYEIIYSGCRKESNDFFKEYPLNNEEIFQLGKIIYYMLFLDFPYSKNNQKSENEETNLINQRLDSLEDQNLKDLISKMLIQNIKQRINWKEYLNHPFFDLKPKYLKFNFICKEHSSKYQEYCLQCKKNICTHCKFNHSSHNLVKFNDIGYNDYEIYQINKIIKYLNKDIDERNEIKTNINEFLEKINKNGNNKYIYENDENNNFKNAFLEYFNNFKSEFNLSIFNELYNNIFNIYNNKSSSNFIIAKIEIEEKNLNKKIRILNFNSELIKFDDLKNICEIYINGTKINFALEYKFNIKGIYTIKYNFKQKLVQTSNLFFDCPLILSIDLSNFDSSEILSMGWMFTNCTSLNKINFLNFDTKNVTDMSLLFYGCKNLKHIDLSNFNTRNVTNMSFMFGKCNSLINLNFLPSFTTMSVTNFNGMFYNCSSLIKLDLSNFNTANAITMSGMFEFCTSLLSLDISNFRTNEITDLSKMFANCSLPSLDLSNFVLNKDVNLSEIFHNCKKLNSLKIPEFKIIQEKVENLKDIFLGMNKNCIIENKDNLISQKWNEYIINQNI